MEIVIATNGLVRPGGTETYCVTVADALEALGHGVTFHAVHQGPFADHLREGGVRVARTEAELADDYDVVVANTADVAYDLAARYPAVPIVYICHSNMFQVQLPPQLPGTCSALVALHDEMAAWAASLASKPQVLRLRQPVDLERFAVHGARRESPRRVLLLGNYQRGSRRAMVEGACRSAGLEAVLVGSATAISDRPELAIWDADIVIGQGRVIVEAMACGRAAYVFDTSGGDGWVTPESYDTLERVNFSGRGNGRIIDREALIADLRAYDPDMGVQNRDLAVQHHSSRVHAQALVELFEQARPAAGVAADGRYREFARLVRRQWNTEGRALGSEHEVERLQVRIAALEQQYDARQHELHEALGALARRDAEVAAGDERVRELELALREEEAKLIASADAMDIVRRSRRYRIGDILAAPVQYLRTWSRRR